MKSGEDQLVIDELRLRFTFLLAVGGILVTALLVVFLVGLGWKTSSEILPLVGIFTTVMGTLAGAFFGFQVGSSGKERERRERMKAQAERIKIQEIADRALAKLDPKDAEAVFQGRNF